MEEGKEGGREGGREGGGKRESQRKALDDVLVILKLWSTQIIIYETF